MIKASNPGLFILLNYTLLTSVVLSLTSSVCAASSEENNTPCQIASSFGMILNCVLLLYVWYRLFTWKC